MKRFNIFQGNVPQTRTEIERKQAMNSVNQTIGISNRGVRRKPIQWVAALALGLSMISLSSLPQINSPAQAIQRADGSIAFAHPPRLLGASTPRNTAAATRVMYYFTLTVPPDAGEPLQKVEIAQNEGLIRLRFDLSKSRAFAGTSRNKGTEFNLTATQAEKGQPISVVFEPPIPPGETVTIGLRSRRNPRGGGVYLFGVTAFPAGEQALGQFIGFGRLQFYDDRDKPFL